MSLCKNKPSTSKSFVGFHLNCGLSVRLTTQSKHGGKYKYVYARCDCGTRVLPCDLTQEHPAFKKQQSCGKRFTRPRFDIKSWREVKP